MRTLMIVLFLGGTFLVGTNASPSEDVETEPLFVATQASGQVRVTLVEVSQRGFFTSVDIHLVEIPSRVDLKTGKIECREKKVFRITIRFKGSEIRRG